MSGNPTERLSRNQRLIVPDHVIPAEQRVLTALDENVIADHLEKFLLAEDNDPQCKVFSSVFGGCHVYCFPPSKILKRNYWTLVSMGMSGTKMNVPGGIHDAQDYEHAEVMCYLPETWQMPLISDSNITENNWPVEMLRSLAMYVAGTRCWIAEDHGIPSLLNPEKPGDRFHSSTKLSNMILLAPVDEEEDFASVKVGDKKVNFYVVVPLTSAEAQWKRDVGAANSIYYIVGNKREYPQNVAVDYVIDASRPCAVEDLHLREYFENLSDEEDEEEDEEEEGGGEEEWDEEEEENDDVDVEAEDVDNEEMEN